jgi:pyrroline-5-carboxylate reductase
MKYQHTVDLTFIGGGVLATSIINGLRRCAGSPNMTQYKINVTVRREEHAQTLREEYPNLLVTTDNQDPRLWTTARCAKNESQSLEEDDNEPSRRIILICTQPQFTSAVCQEISTVIKHRSEASHPIFVTMCPGITIKQVETWLRRKVPVVRTMPNTPVCKGQGATAMFANPLVSEKDIEQIVEVFRLISPAVCLLPHESLLDVAASISG